MSLSDFSRLNFICHLYPYSVQMLTSFWRTYQLLDIKTISSAYNMQPTNKDPVCKPSEQGMGHSQWPMTHGSRGPSPHIIASLTQIYRLPGTVFGHCICTHTFKLLHNGTCKQTAHTGTCKFGVCLVEVEILHNITKTGNHIHSFISRAKLYTNSWNYRTFTWSKIVKIVKINNITYSLSAYNCITAQPQCNNMNEPSNCCIEALSVVVEGLH